MALAKKSFMIITYAYIETKWFIGWRHVMGMNRRLKRQFKWCFLKMQSFSYKSKILGNFFLDSMSIEWFIFCINFQIFFFDFKIVKLLILFVKLMIFRVSIVSLVKRKEEASSHVSDAFDSNFQWPYKYIFHQ